MNSADTGIADRKVLRAGQALLHWDWGGKGACASLIQERSGGVEKIMGKPRGHVRP